MANSTDASDTFIRHCMKGTETFPFCLEINLVFMSLSWLSSSGLKLPYRGSMVVLISIILS